MENPAKPEDESLIEPIKFSDTPEAPQAPLAKKKPSRYGHQGEFCVVDRRTLEFIIENAQLQTALPVFICLASCSDASNTTTRAGVNACCNHLGLSRRAATLAIESLVQLGVLERLDLTEVRDPTVARFRIRAIEEIRREPKSEIEPDPDFAVFLPNSIVRTDAGRSPLGRLLATGLPGSIPTLVNLYAELDFESFSGIAPKIMSSRIPKIDRTKAANYQITRLEKPAVLDGTMPEVEHLGAHFRALKDNPWIVENLRYEGLLQWVVWLSQGTALSDFAGFPLMSFGANGADMGAVETSVGLAHHLLAELISGNGKDWRELSELHASFRDAPNLSHVGMSFSSELKAIATIKLQHRPRSVLGLAWENTTRKQCRDLVHDVVHLVERDFPDAAKLARQLLQAFEKPS